MRLLLLVALLLPTACSPTLERAPASPADAFFARLTAVCYELSRSTNRLLRVRFDLRRSVPAPPPPWGTQ